jgi:peptide/nickel transport system substrate-binding protein
VAGGNGRLVGTGPYRLINFTPGSTIELERFDGYFNNSPKGKGAIKKIRYRTIPDNATQIAELLSGGLDWIWNVPREQAQRLATVKKLEVKTSETMRISFLSFNMRDMSVPNPVQNPKVRQAIAHAVDREKLVKYVIGEGSRVVKSACYSSQAFCRQDVVQYNYDPAKARKLLAEAGYPNGMTLELVAWRNREWTEALTGYLNAVGIKTNITQLAYGAAMDRIKSNSVHLYYGDWASFSINDVSAFLNVFYTLSPEDMAQDKELAGWLKLAGGTVEQKVRKENYDKALAKIADQLYMQPLWVHPALYAHSADLQFKPYPDENPRLYFARWKQ